MSVRLRQGRFGEGERRETGRAAALSAGGGGPATGCGRRRRGQGPGVVLPSVRAPACVQARTAGCLTGAARAPGRGGPGCSGTLELAGRRTEPREPLLYLGRSEE